MGIQSFTPSGGGGTPGFDYIASIRMETYNRSWAQSGAAGNYILTSNNMNSGYVYFVGSSLTTGSPLGKVVNVAHSFTSVNVIAPTGDFMSLYKASVKSTTVFSSPFANFASFPSQITSSGNFVLPTSALPLVDALVVGAGGSGGGNHAGGGGGGGAILKLTGYQAVGTTSITIGTSGGHDGTHGYNGGSTYFGNVFAIGGTGGSGSTTRTTTQIGANGGGGCGHSKAQYSDGIDSGSAYYSYVTAGFGTQSGTVTYQGGYRGGTFGGNHAGGGGGGAGGIGNAASGTTPGGGGNGHVSNITGTNYTYAWGGGGGSYSPNNAHGNTPGTYGSGGHGAHNGPENNASGGTQGIVVVRYYIA
jgi:hypothetical protein